MKIKVRIDDEMHLSPVSELSKEALQAIKAWLSFENPAWLENEKRGFSNWDTPRMIVGYEQQNDMMTLPRGGVTKVVGILRQCGVAYYLIDVRRSLPSVAFQFRGELLDFQNDAIEAISRNDFGVLSAPTGSGKTVIALAMIAKRRQPALIVVHTRELADQWIDRAETFLGIPAAEIGMIGNGKQSIGEKITIALVQSLYKCAASIAPKIGFLIIDECHRAPSRTFTEAVTAFDCQYQLGLSATPFRRDGLTRLISWHLGRRLHTIEEDVLIAAGHVLPAEVVIRPTDYLTRLDPTTEYSAMLSDLTGDMDRNNLIVDDIAKEAGNGGGVCLVLTDRKAHCEALVDLLAARGIKGDMLTGDLPPSERRQVVEDLNAGRVKVLVATGQLIGEGFDCKTLQTLFLATPIKFDGRLIQYLGRVLRPAPGKTEARVYDYHDKNVPVLMAQARSRSRVFARRENHTA